MQIGTAACGNRRKARFRCSRRRRIEHSDGRAAGGDEVPAGGPEGKSADPARYWRPQPHHAKGDSSVRLSAAGGNRRGGYQQHHHDVGG